MIDDASAFVQNVYNPTNNQKSDDKAEKCGTNVAQIENREQMSILTPVIVGQKYVKMVPKAGLEPAGVLVKSISYMIFDPFLTPKRRNLISDNLGRIKRGIYKKPKLTKIFY